MRRIGLTGGIASGKSTVAAMFAELGAHVLDADLAAREAVAPGSPALEAIAAEFGPEVFAPDGSLDRAALRRLIFSDQVARQRLNAIVHPEVSRRINDELRRLAAEDPEGTALVDVPLLFESGWDGLFEAVVVVWVPPEEQVGRLIERDSVARGAAEASLKAQMPLGEKRRRAQFVIDNSGPVEETRKQVSAVWERLQAVARDHPTPSEQLPGPSKQIK